MDGCIEYKLMRNFLVLYLLLVSCTPSISHDTLLPGIGEPRPRESINITIHEVDGIAWGKCLEIVGPVSAIFSVILLAPYRACALVARDSDLKPGQQPWCHIWVPKDSPKLLEHELLHCEGYRHDT